jgi:hypothetical protein
LKAKDTAMKKLLLSLATVVSLGIGSTDVEAHDSFRWTPPRVPSSPSRTVYRPDLRFSGFEYRTGGPSGGITLRFGGSTPVPHHHGHSACRPCGCPHSHTHCRHSRDYDRRYDPRDYRDYRDYRDSRDSRDYRDYRDYRGW